MTTEYNGKYPNRIESVWRVSKEIDARQPWMFRTNIGALYKFTPSPLMVSPSHLLGAEADTVPSAKWVDNSMRRVPGRKWRLGQ